MENGLSLVLDFRKIGGGFFRIYICCIWVQKKNVIQFAGWMPAVDSGGGVCCVFRGWIRCYRLCDKPASHSACVPPKIFVPPFRIANGKNDVRHWSERWRKQDGRRPLCATKGKKRFSHFPHTHIVKRAGDRVHTASSIWKISNGTGRVNGCTTHIFRPKYGIFGRAEQIGWPNRSAILCTLLLMLRPAIGMSWALNKTRMAMGHCENRCILFGRLMM